MNKSIATLCRWLVAGLLGLASGTAVSETIWASEELQNPDNWLKDRVGPFLAYYTPLGVRCVVSPYGDCWEFRYTDRSAYGFYDSTPVDPLPSNPETTLGAQRRYAFRAGLQRWADWLPDTNVPIRVFVDFTGDTPMIECDSDSGQMGTSKGSSVYLRDFPNAPPDPDWYPEDWKSIVYPGGLAQMLMGEYDDRTGDYDMVIALNLNVGQPGCIEQLQWYYGTDGQYEAYKETALLEVVSHEVGHGMGFTNVGISKHPSFFGKLGSTISSFDIQLENHESGKRLVDDTMTQGQRAEYLTTPGAVHWIGKWVRKYAKALTAGTVGDHVEMFTPSEVMPASTLSHWGGNQRPYDTMYWNAQPFEKMLISQYAMKDMGWPIKVPQAPPNVYCQQSNHNIGDNASFSVSQRVVDGLDVGRMGVSIRLDHSYLADVRLTLSHGGKTVVLYDGPSEDTPNCGGRNMNMMLWDGADTAVEGRCSGTPAIKGEYRPLESLSAFRGMDSSGKWTLEVADGKTGDTGILKEWCVYTISHGECDGVDVELKGRTVGAGQTLVCNAGRLKGSDNVVEPGGQLIIHYSGDAKIFNGLTVQPGGTLKVRHRPAGWEL